MGLHVPGPRSPCHLPVGEQRDPRLHGRVGGKPEALAWGKEGRGCFPEEGEVGCAPRAGSVGCTPTLWFSDEGTPQWRPEQGWECGEKGPSPPWTAWQG